MKNGKSNMFFKLYGFLLCVRTPQGMGRKKKADERTGNRKNRAYKRFFKNSSTIAHTVKRILRKNREFFIQGSNFTINRKTKEENTSTKLFVSQDAERLYSIYKTEKDNAPEDEYQLALEKLKDTDSNIFLQGLAGTGKSFLIKEYLESLSESKRSKVLLVAPTGKAADVIGGVTIHTAFELQPTLQLPDEIATIPKMLRNINTLIVDEVSMVRIDLFDKMMQILKFSESKGQKIRLIFVGDIGQIGPTISKVDNEILKILYPGIKGYYAFNSDKWAKANFEKILLFKIKRQKDAELIEHLNGIRFGRIEDIMFAVKDDIHSVFMYS